MKKIQAVTFVIYVMSFVALLGPVESTQNPLVGATAQAQEYLFNEPFSPQQLDNLLAPIALYPDPLLAQVLVAATFVDQVDQAAHWMRAYNNTTAIDDQPWDISVKAVAHYLPVLYRMSDQIDWTTAVGQAYVYQPTDVMTSVQRLRSLARSAGNLVTNEQQQVDFDGDSINIVPAQPRYVYVPTYDPNIIYFGPGYYSGGLYPASTISFGPPFPIGAWLNNDFDWPRRRIYYHGLQGRGWIARSRPMIRITHLYVNNYYSNVQINRQIVRHHVNYVSLNRHSSIHRDVNYNNLTRNERRFASNPNAADRSIRRSPDITAPGPGSNGGHPTVQKPVTREERLSPTARLQRPPSAVWEARPPTHTRSQLATVQRHEPSQTARPAEHPLRKVQRRRGTVVGDNMGGFEPQRLSRHTEEKRSPANQPTTIRPANGLNPPPRHSIPSAQGLRP